MTETPMANDQKFETPCGGCGAELRRERCIGCMHEMLASTPAKPVGELVEKLTANRTVNMSWPDAALLAIQAEQNLCLDAASALTTLAAERDALREESANLWRYFGAKAQIMSDKLTASQAANAALLEDCESYKASDAENFRKYTASQAQVATLTAALADVKDAAKSFRDESGDEVAGQVVLRVDAALNHKTSQQDDNKGSEI